MATLKRYMQLVLMIAAIAVLYYIPVDFAMPYVLPITVVGVVAILSFVFYTLKKRGLLALAFIAMFSLTTGAKAYDIIDCGGTYNTNGQSIVNALQDATLNGNVWSSDFSDKSVLACVIVNITNLHSEICNGVKNIKDTYDPKVRAKAFYVMDNYYRMDADEATDNVDNSFVSDLINKSGNQALINAHAAAVQYGKQNGIGEFEAKLVFQCAKEYTEKAAKIDRKNEANCGNVMNKVKENSKDCWVCDIVHLVIESIQLMAGNTYQLMQWLALRLLGVIFLFWIAIKVLIFIGQMGYADNGEFMTDMLVRFIVVAIAAAILHAPIVDFYRIIISPFVGLSANLAGAFTEMSMTDGEKTFAEITESRAGAKAGEICGYCTDMNDPDFKFPRKREGLQTSNGNTVYVEVMDDQTINGILCLTCKVYRQVTPFIAIGQMFSCHANAVAFNVPLTSIYIPNIFWWIVGWVIIIPFSVLAVIVGFYLIDIVLRLGFVIVLTPLYIVAWAFPISREYSTKAWHLILYSLLQFIGVAIMIALFLALCLQVIPGGEPKNLLDAMAANDVEKMFRIVTGVDPLVAATGAVVIAAAASTAGALLLLFIFAAFLAIAIKMLTATESIVQNLSGISLGIPGIALGALTAMVKGAASLAGKAGSAATKVGSKAGDAAKKGFDKAKEKSAKGETGQKASKKNRFEDKDNKKNKGDKGSNDANTPPNGGPNNGPGGGDSAGNPNGGGDGGESNETPNDNVDNPDTNAPSGVQENGQASQSQGQNDDNAKGEGKSGDGFIKRGAKAVGMAAKFTVRHPIKTARNVIGAAVAIPKKAAELPGKVLSAGAEKVGFAAGTLFYKFSNKTGGKYAQKGLNMMTSTSEKMQNAFNSKINAPARVAFAAGRAVVGAVLVADGMVGSPIARTTVFVTAPIVKGVSRSYEGIKAAINKMQTSPKTGGNPPKDRTIRVNPKPGK